MSQVSPSLLTARSKEVLGILRLGDGLGQLSLKVALTEEASSRLILAVRTKGVLLQGERIVDVLFNLLHVDGARSRTLLAVLITDDTSSSGRVVGADGAAGVLAELGALLLSGDVVVDVSLADDAALVLDHVVGANHLTMPVDTLDGGLDSA